jgi:hypothetical protein
MRRALLSNLQTAVILEVRGNPRRPEGVVSDLRMDAGSRCPPAVYSDFRAVRETLRRFRRDVGWVFETLISQRNAPSR